jgi:hypothetical protein
MEKVNNFNCPKCNNNIANVDTIQTTGGFFSKIFDIQNKKFTAVSCANCGYTELYKKDTGTLGNVFDFFTS